MYEKFNSFRNYSECNERHFVFVLTLTKVRHSRIYPAFEQADWRSILILQKIAAT